MALKSTFTVVNGAISLTPTPGILYDFCSAILTYYNNHPDYRLIAWNSGSVGGGFDPRYGSNPVRENSFFIYRAVSSSTPYDIAIKVATGSYDTGRNEWKTVSDTGLAVGITWHSSGEAWQGTTNNDGSDRFTDPGKPWKSGSLSVLRINGVGGLLQTKKNGLFQLASPTQQDVANIAITGDKDYTYIHIAQLREPYVGVGTPTSCYFGTYTPFSSSYNVPLVLNNFVNNQNYETGRTNTTTTDYDGGLIYTSSLGSLEYSIGNTGLGTAKLGTANNGVDQSLATHEMPSVVQEFPIMLTTAYYLASDWPTNDPVVRIFGKFKGVNIVSTTAYAYRFYQEGSKFTINTWANFLSLAWDSGSIGVSELNKL